MTALDRLTGGVPLTTMDIAILGEYGLSLIASQTPVIPGARRRLSLIVDQCATNRVCTIRVPGSAPGWQQPTAQSFIVVSTITEVS